MLFPATAVAGPLLLIETSACALMVVFALELLFEELMSALDVVAVAVLLTTVPFTMLAEACTVIVNCALAPLLSSEMLHATVPPLPTVGILHVAAGPVFCTSATKTTPAGSGSLND